MRDQGIKGESVSASSGEKVYSVTELTREIRALLEGRFPRVWVEGEISGFKHHHSGHMYFGLKDEGAVLKAAFFQRHQANLRFKLEDGLQVLCFGRVSVYEPRGEYQIYVERIEPKGWGARELALAQLKAKLAKEGLFEASRKRPIPSYPNRIGVVTSPTGAAIRDILNVLGRRFAGMQLLLNPVRVQGEGAAEEIARAIDEMNLFEDIDVLIVGRGGGSLEDLWAFNEEAVARAIARSRIPVISAVGHEIDWTIADFVADLRAPTPSAAAELVTESRLGLESGIFELGIRMIQAMRKLKSEKGDELEGFASSYAFKQPFVLVDTCSQRLDDFGKQLAQSLKGILSGKDGLLRTLAAKLEALSPLSVLARGYSLTFDTDGKLLRDAAAVHRGDRVRTRLARGEFESEVLQRWQDGEGT